MSFPHRLYFEGTRASHVTTSRRTRIYKDLLYCKDLYASLGGDMVKPRDKSDEDQAIIHRKIVTYIQQLVDHNIYHYISQETRADVL